MNKAIESEKNRSRIKVAMIRGANLNRYELQTYERLSQSSDFEIITFSALLPEHDTSSIALPNRKILCTEDFVRYLVPGRIKKHARFTLNNIIGVKQLMFGLTGKLEGFEIVHTADPSYYFSYQAAKAKDKYNFRLVVTQWENVPFLYERNKLMRKVKYTVMTKANHFIAMSERAKETLSLEGVSPEKITVAPVGVDIDRFRPREKSSKLLRDWSLQDKDILISFIGKLVYYKGVEFLLCAFKKLKLDHEIKNLPGNVKLAFFGEGGKKDRLVELAQRLSVEKDTIFYGFYPYDQIEDVYNTTDIFVLPSLPVKMWQEQLGMVLLESMASGCAVISTRSGSIPEVVGSAALLCNPGDFYDLYLKIKKLCLDEKLRNKLGKKGRERVCHRYNSEINSEKIRAIYEMLLTG